MIQGQQPHHAAPNVHKGAEPLQVGDFSPHHCAGRTVLQQELERALLGLAPGEDQNRLSAAGDGDGCDDELDAVPHPGKHCDLPVSAADQGGDGLGPGDDALIAAETDVEVVPGVTADGQGLRHLFCFDELLNDGQRQGRQGEGPIALR